MLKSLPLVVSIIFPVFLFAQNSFTNNANNNELHRQSSLIFIENKGQIIDQNHNQRSDIDFKISGNGVNVFVGRGKLHYQFTKAINSQKQKSISGQASKRDLECYRMDVSLVGANTNAEILTEDRQEYYETYYLPQCNGAIAHTYKKVTYKNIYPGIDWVLYEKENKFEYDFVVHPGGNVDDIKLHYDGTNKMLRSVGGNIIASTLLGKVTEQHLYAYEQETGKKIGSDFVLNKNKVGFKVGAYSGTLIIDPQVVWGTYYGGDEDERGGAVACYNSDNVYLAGSTNSNQYIATGGTYKDTISGFSDLFIAKFTANGLLQWGTYFGGDSTEDAVGSEWGITSYSGSYDYTFGGTKTIATDNVGNVYITGNTRSRSGLATKGTYSGNTDVVLAKFNNAGARIWSTYYGGNNVEHATGVVCDKWGNAYISGLTYSDTGIASTGAFHSSLSGTLDGFLAKFDTAGNRLWGTYYGGRYGANVSDMACDRSGNVYIVGTTSSDTGIASPGGYETFDTSGAAYLAKFAPSGARLWATYFGDTLGTEGSSVACDTNNNVFISGITNDGNLATSGAYLTGPKSGPNFLTKFDSSGSEVWCTYLKHMGRYIICDNVGNIIAAANQGYGDNEIYAIDAAGKHLLWHKSFGAFIKTPRADYPTTSMVAFDGNFIYLAGNTQYDDSIATPGSHKSTLTPDLDAFLIKYTMDTGVYISQSFNDSLICKGGSFSVPYLVSGNFNAGNVFTIQLSDDKGKFTSPANIGSVTSTSAGTISCTIPSGTVISTHYRIRVTASSPLYISPDNGFDINVADSISPVTITSNNPVCTGDKLQITVHGPAGTTYTWAGPMGFTSALAALTINPFLSSKAGDYTVTAHGTNCPSVNKTITVTVKAIVTPTVNITVSPDTVFKLGSSYVLIANVTNAGSRPLYKWYKNGNIIAGDSINVLIIDSIENGDIITVQLKSSDFCAFPDTVSASTGRLQLPSLTGGKARPYAFPNPTTGIVQIENAENCTYTISDVAGRVLQQGNIASPKQEINISSLHAGLYILQLTNTGNEKQCLKITKE